MNNARIMIRHTRYVIRLFFSLSLSEFCFKPIQSKNHPRRKIRMNQVNRTKRTKRSTIIETLNCQNVSFVFIWFRKEDSKDFTDCWTKADRIGPPSSSSLFLFSLHNLSSVALLDDWFLSKVNMRSSSSSSMRWMEDENEFNRFQFICFHVVVFRNDAFRCLLPCFTWNFSEKRSCLCRAVRRRCCLSVWKSTNKRTVEFTIQQSTK